MLNRIPIADGGTEGMLGSTLKVPVVSGISSDELYKAILHFQKKQFGTMTGFIDTIGRDMPRLEYLTARIAAPAPNNEQWDDLKSGSVQKALRKALDGDLTLDHSEIVDIIRSTLSDGIVSSNELTICRPSRPGPGVSRRGRSCCWKSSWNK